MPDVSPEADDRSAESSRRRAGFAALAGRTLPARTSWSERLRAWTAVTPAS